MTVIHCSIKIGAPAASIWHFFDIRRWPEISDVFSLVSIYTKILRLKTKAEVESRLSRLKINYTITISEWEENEKLAFKRFDGPLPGDSRFILTAIDGGTIIEYDSRFLHNLSDALQREIAAVMQEFLNDLKCAAESQSPIELYT